MRRENDCIKEFKNGNIRVKFSPDILSDIKSGKSSDIENLLWIFDSLDIYCASAEYCLSNYDMAFTAYNVNYDCAYVVPFSALDTLKSGKSVTFYAYNPDAEECKEIEKFMNDEV